MQRKDEKICEKLAILTCLTCLLNNSNIHDHFLNLIQCRNFNQGNLGILLFSATINFHVLVHF